MKLKAILLGVGFSVMTAGISLYAQTEIVRLGDIGGIRMIPKTFTKEKTATPYSYELRDGIYTYTIYDADWKVKKTFNAESVKRPGSFIKRREMSGISDSTVIRQDPIDVYENGEWTATPTFAAATGAAANRGFNIVVPQSDNVVIFLSDNDEYYYRPDLYGHAHAKSYLVYSTTECLYGLYWFYEVECSFKDSYCGDWIVEGEGDFDEFFVDIRYTDHDIDCVDNNVYVGDGRLFQNIFTSDGKYESFRPVLTPTGRIDTLRTYDRDYDGIIDELYLMAEIKMSGIEVLVDGVVLKKLEISPINEYSEVDIIRLDGILYLQVEDDEFTSIYRIDSQQNSISLVKKVPATRMYPSIAKSGEAVTVEFGTGDTAVAGELVITDAAGKVVERRSVPAGTADMQINTRRLRAGSYNFTVYRGGKVADNGKIIIR